MAKGPLKVAQKNAKHAKKALAKEKKRHEKAQQALVERDNSSRGT